MGGSSQCGRFEDLPHDSGEVFFAQEGLVVSTS
jgi:hypothetical protein